MLSLGRRVAVLTATLTSRGHLGAGVCVRGQTVMSYDRVTLLCDAADGKMWLALTSQMKFALAFTLLGR